MLTARFEILNIAFNTVIEKVIAIHCKKKYNNLSIPDGLLNRILHNGLYGV